MFPKGNRGYGPALSASQPTAQTRIVKELAEGRRLERLCPEGLWLNRPEEYQFTGAFRVQVENAIYGEITELSLIHI